MNEERIKKVFSDEEFVKELFSKESPEEAQALLAEKDIDMSIEDLVKLKDFIVAKLQAVESGESEELTEEDLADIAGGWGMVIAGAVGALIISLIIAPIGFKLNKPRW